MRRSLTLTAVWAACLVVVTAHDLRLPVENGSTKFAVIGDTGTGDKAQYEVGKLLGEYHQQFPFDVVLMMGDNLYGGERPQDYVNKFEKPYQTLLDAGVKFHATLGNHDDPNQRFYKNFNMGGERYYTFSKGPIEFFVLDSNYMEPRQLSWLEQKLQGSRANWKIAYFHHPLYSSGARHGSEADLRTLLEPLFLKYGMNVVFAGHEHFYERIRPQNGVYYFTVGGSAKLRKGNIRRGELTAEGFDTDNSFLLVEIAGDTLHFQAISRIDKTFDTGALPKIKGAKPTDANK
jgi:hypothetical protein